MLNLLPSCPKTMSAIGRRRWYKPVGTRMDGDSELAKPSRQNFIDNFRALLQIQAMSLADLARAIDVPRSQITLWKNGKRFPQAEQLDKIAEALGVPVSILLHDPTDLRSSSSALRTMLEHIVERDLPEQERRMWMVFQIINGVQMLNTPEMTAITEKLKSREALDKEVINELVEAAWASIMGAARHNGKKKRSEKS